MKNLKMFAISLVAFAAMTMGVHATGSSRCIAPGEDSYDTASYKCVATYKNARYEDFASAWADALASDGGTITLLSDVTSLGSMSTGNVTKNITINIADHTLTLGGQDFAVKANNSLKFVGTGVVTSTATKVVSVEADGSFATEGALLLETSGATLIEAAGNVTISAGAELKAATDIVKVTGHGAEISLNANVGDSKTDGAAHLVSVEPSIVILRGKAATKVTIEGGNYYTSALAIAVEEGINVVVNNGTIVAKTANAIKLVKGDVTVNNGTLKTLANGASAILYSSGAEGNLTITGGAFNSKLGFALSMNSKDVTVKISDGTFESGKTGNKQNPALYIDDNLLTSLVDGGEDDVFEGILTGGKYLDTIIGGAYVSSKSYAAEDVVNHIVAKGYKVVEDGDYKKVVKEGSEDQNTGDANTPETQDPNVPSNPPTSDNILVYAGLGLISAATVGFTTRRKENN